MKLTREQKRALLSSDLAIIAAETSVGSLGYGIVVYLFELRGVSHLSSLVLETLIEPTAQLLNFKLKYVMFHGLSAKPYRWVKRCVYT